ncbi:bromodomain-containing protein 8 isoform X2 [Microcaecilia unicolor]|uniref:Bromodomain-containing protein 8 n=2 Tax=Microcaecilia unicolor TaxID=1415580 RepID=A0A6P7YV23_9AMPH|nr:bromodomain-containing protein 8 isoform X2 [Microcaecilia unicolor]
MASGMGKHKLMSIGPAEPWSIREKLCLASSVMRSGDQNWVSVSRAIKPFAEPGRPPDWFSQKHCASQYSELLETTETPKRKRGEKGEVVETVEDVIVRRLTAERIEELKKAIKETQEKYRKLKKEAELIQTGHMDSKLEELWNDIVLQKKLEEEEAEMKKKATDAAYQARQAAKNAPRRPSMLTSRSPADALSPGGDYNLGDISQSTTEEGSSVISVGSLPGTPVSSYLGIADTPPPASVSLDGPLTPVTDDSPQKKLMGQKGTPPPSPLLSELLKKSSLLSTSPRLQVSENEMALASNQTCSIVAHMDVGMNLSALHAGDLPSASVAIPSSPAASGAPSLSRLLEAGPAQFSTPLPPFSAVSCDCPANTPLPPLESVSQHTILMMPTLAASKPVSAAPVTPPDACTSVSSIGDPHTMTVSVDNSDISMIIDSINKECLEAGEVPGMPKDAGVDGKEDLDLAEKMGIAVSYTGEELDFDTVGDIIAIIEDKVDEHPEVLDVAAVEAALSFCEENDDPQSLPGPWDQTLQEEKPGKQVLPVPELVTVKQEKSCCEEIEGAGIRGLIGIRELGSEVKSESSEQDHIGQGEAGPILKVEPVEFRIGAEKWKDAGETSEIESSSRQGDRLPFSVKAEASLEKISQTEHFSSDSGHGPRLDPEPALQLLDTVKEEPRVLSGSQDKGEDDDDDDGTSEAGSLEEPKEDEMGTGDLSETDNEPPVSESDDGFSMHNAPLQSHTLADSIPSSPASSQFSVCSEDQEAIQAQKIWKKAIMLVWRAAANHRYANVFLQPVTDDIAPGYHSIVQRPMDLSTIKKNIETGQIRSTAEFQRDIMLMFQNAVMYNSSDHDVYHMAVEMQRDVLEQIQQFLATQLIMQTSESGISAKSLRGRDSTRKQDSSEKDSVPMGSPAFLLSLFDGGTRGRRCAIEADMKMKK